MDTKALLQFETGLAEMVCLSYVNDLSDADLMVRPAPGCNHIKWQLGHLIHSEHQMLEELFPGRMPALPDGFAARYSKDRAASDDPAAFDSKERLLETYRTQRAAALGLLEEMTPGDFARPTTERIQSYAPTLAAAFSLLGSHWMMHCGQWAVVRRKLGHPPLF